MNIKMPEYDINAAHHFFKLKNIRFTWATNFYRLFWLHLTSWDTPFKIHEKLIRNDIISHFVIHFSVSPLWCFSFKWSSNGKIMTLANDLFTFNKANIQNIRINFLGIKMLMLQMSLPSLYSVKLFRFG